jgi:EmrB/QacA subfamily drug resistance transporter
MPKSFRDSSPTPAGELPRRAVIASMIGIASAMLMAALDATIVGTAMPRVITELHGFEQYAAVTTVYLLASTVVLPLAGKLSDLYGRKPFLLAGVAVFAVASALCGAAQSMTQLIVFRGLQGIGGGLSQGMAFTTIADLFPPARRGRISGLMGSIFGLASVVGPAVGGFLTDGPGWRWCFYVNIPVGIAAFIVLLIEFPRHTVHPEQRRIIDWLGALTLVLGIVPTLLALSWGGSSYPWSSPMILGLLAAGGSMTVAFLLVETRAREPIIPPSLFRHRVVWTSAVAATGISIGMFGTTLFIPLFIQAVIGSSATESGAVLTPMMLALIAASIVSGQLIARMGKYRAIAVVGMATTVVGGLMLTLMTRSTSYVTVVGNMMVMGIGLGITMPVFTLAVQNAVDPRLVGVATSSIQFLRTMGGSLGAAIFGAVLANRFGPALGAAMPADAARTLPPAVLAAFSTPQALMNPATTARLASGAESTALAPIVAAVRLALARSLHEVFLAGTLVVAVSAVVTLMMVDIPLRTTNRQRSVEGDEVAVEPVVIGS